MTGPTWQAAPLSFPFRLGTSVRNLPMRPVLALPQVRLGPATRDTKGGG
jgi:hypothetical protein